MVHNMHFTDIWHITMRPYKHFIRALHHSQFIIEPCKAVSSCKAQSDKPFRSGLQCHAFQYEGSGLLLQSRQPYSAALLCQLLSA